MASLNVTPLSLLKITLCLLAFGSLAFAQEERPDGQQPAQADDVVRISTELVQTDVSVFDKQGRFIDGLKKEDFELTIGGKPLPVSFFESVIAGSSREASQLAAARGLSPASSVKTGAGGDEESRGRVIIFFLDDLHLSKEGMTRAREALARFVDEDMGVDDQVAIVSTSGQVGFLQQLTDDKVVLRAAISRLNYKGNPETYAGSTQISEYMASQIQDAGNRRLYTYLLESIKVEYGMGMGAGRGFHGNNSGMQAANILQSRVREISAETRMQTADTLSVLGSLMLSSSRLPGRKLVFFLSDGFIIDARKSNAPETLRRVTQAAARTGAVVYTMDTRGTILDPTVDASRNDYFDPSARRSGILTGEVSATREPLSILADETGGRAIFNSNSISDDIRQAVGETSAYYLLAWRPGSEQERNERGRIKVSIRNRPELRVRLRSSYYAPPAETGAKPYDETDAARAKESKAVPSTAEDELIIALGSAFAEREIPVSVTAGYVNTAEQGSLLRIAAQLDPRALFRTGEDKSAELDVLGAAIDDRGQLYTFKQLLKARADAGEPARPFTWTEQLRLRPGLYQVRVAVRERKSGRTGTAMQWVEVPDISKGRFDLSSIFLGERRPETISGKEPYGPGAVSVDVDHSFARTSILRFQTYVYNGAPGSAGVPEVWIQARVLRNTRTLINTSAFKVPTGTTRDMSRLPFWTELSLAELPRGRYTLEVTATDRTGKTNAVRRINFTVR
jgi:VWFA-related protein